MGDPDEDCAGHRRRQAVSEFDSFFASLSGASPLSDSKLAPYQRRGCKQGWQVAHECSDGTVLDLFVLLDADFPYAPPRIAIRNSPKALSWPHLEADGFLCLLPPGSSVDIERPVDVVEHLLEEASQLIEDGIETRGEEDFRKEFHSYWSIAVGNASRYVTSLLEPRGPSRRVAVSRVNDALVVGESPNAVESWIRRQQNASKNNRKPKVEDGAFIWLPRPLVPSQYPNTATGLLALASEHAPVSVNILRDLAVPAPPRILVVLGSRSETGVCFGAVTIHKPRKQGGPIPAADPMSKGFRPGRMPPGLQANRYLGGTDPMAKAHVERADHNWIHGRDHDRRQSRLRNAQVAFVGCGSVGGAVVRLVAQAGVGNLILVDPEELNRANTGRHILGARSAGKLKAMELASEIESAFPHLNSVVPHLVPISPANDELMAQLLACNLIVSTCADWTAECFLNDWQQEKPPRPPILYGWVEPHAAAAHAVVITSGNGCLRCGVNELGKPRLRVTDWPRDIGDVQEPGCGAFFSPYGPAELCWAHALIAETAVAAIVDRHIRPLHRIWIGSCDHLEEQGGRWSKEWLDEVGVPAQGCFMVDRDWATLPDCPACSSGRYN